MKALYDPLLKLGAFKAVARGIEENKTPVLSTGVTASQNAHMIWAICHRLERSACCIAATELDAKALYEDLRFFFGNSAVYFPAKDIIFYNADVHSYDLIKQRQSALRALTDQTAGCVVLCADVLFDRLTPKKFFLDNCVEIETGKELEQADLVKRLSALGYTRSPAEVEGHGQFAVRGGIVDICPPFGECGFRVEFWGDTVESIRRFDITTRRSYADDDRIEIFPASELICGPKAQENALKTITPLYEKALSDFEQKGKREEAANIRASVGEDLRLLSEGAHRSFERFALYMFDEETNLTDYLPQDALMFINEPRRIRAHCENLFEEFIQSMENRIKKGHMLPSQINMLLSYDTVMGKIRRFDVVSLAQSADSSDDFSPYAEKVVFPVRSTVVVKGNLAQLCEDLHAYTNQGQAVLFLCGSASKAEKFADDLSRDGLNAVFVRDITDYDLPEGQITVTKGTLRKGFSYEEIKLTVISDAEVFGARKKRRRIIKNASPLESFLDLAAGDYVVHRTHGIGLYCGMEKIVTDDVAKDYMKLSYAGGAILYVPVNNMDAVQKYIGGENASPKLHKLGSGEFIKAKRRASAAAELVAADLIELYAGRQAAKGYAFSPDTIWQTQFEERFPFDETEDQLQSIEEVKSDMESAKVMDRLLCGDVGYGKTEVALRAAFKAVQDNKQVAFLVPTTILAQQHYNTFTERMKDFPVVIELLSRFRTKKQQDESAAKLRKGLADIAVGTHRLLSKDIAFKDLGLIIIDEEQRFGVAHKEKLKRMRENVDVLTLTATPIPRTLHMSLSGLRDMSTLREPPLERHPVQTYVLEHNPEFVRDAIHRELARGGQVYYLHNRVRSIETVTERLRTLVPEARIASAHGQMYERDLEDVMRSFLENEIDVLVCTTIIETGLDIANVNTIIVGDADRMGLAQLYQLRGRVGRSNRIAYAYLMYKKDKTLDEAAQKRLATIREFTEFGSGFRIAMRDLEYRGAGNLLGAQQHGHMDSVGYEMYCTMLKEAMSRLRGDPVEKTAETSIDIKINAYIPDSYIPSETVKLEIYKKIAALQTAGDYNDITDELNDRFGKPPKSVVNLLDVAALKACAGALNVVGITQKQNTFVFTFRDNEADLPNLLPVMNEMRGKLTYIAGTQPHLAYKPSEAEQITPSWLKGFLEMLAGK